MKFAIAVHGAPYASEASQTALKFASAVIESGHEIYRVFFYHDGVYNGNSLSAPPQDEPDLHDAWTSLHDDHQVELIICIASALRRGVLNDTEAIRYEKSAANTGAAFEISGLGQLIDAALHADRTITFGAPS